VRRASPGFTLLEVLVAMCIIAIAFGAIYRAQAQGITMTGEARDVTKAGLLAQDKMAVLTSSVPQYGLRRGNFGSQWPGFSWEERVTGATEFGAEMRHVQVTVFWGPGDAARRLALEGYVLEPVAEEDKDKDKTDEEAAADKKPSNGQQPKAPASGTKKPPADEGDEE